MNYRKRPFKLDLMSALLIVVLLGVALTMIAQAGEASPDEGMAAAYPVSQTSFISASLRSR